MVKKLEWRFLRKPSPEGTYTWIDRSAEIESYNCTGTVVRGWKCGAKKDDHFHFTFEWFFLFSNRILALRSSAGSRYLLATVFFKNHHSSSSWVMANFHWNFGSLRTGKKEREKVYFSTNILPYLSQEPLLPLGWMGCYTWCTSAANLCSSITRRKNYLLMSSNEAFLKLLICLCKSSNILLIDCNRIIWRRCLDTAQSAMEARHIR